MLAMAPDAAVEPESAIMDATALKLRLKRGILLNVASKSLPKIFKQPLVPAEKHLRLASRTMELLELALINIYPSQG